ncbi:MAG TPA: hypothetical protein VHC46_09620, partial [Thermodesulfobacteriota bacterium]|nr:hypothetical protein [Thermodesulfobacteriota bacterium]
MRSYVYKAAIFLCAAIVLAVPFFASADTLYVSPSSGSYTPGQTFSARVYVSSLAQAINAVSGTVTFPVEKLQVVSVSKTGSILTLWVQDPSFSNSQGTVSFEGVVPNPGFSGSGGSLVTITFRVVGQGTAQIKFSSGSVLANDGSGTNILKNLYNATYMLSGSTEPASPAPTVSAPATDSEPAVDPLAPKKPIVRSSTYPDSTHWYAVHEGAFSWDVPGDVSSARILLGRLPGSTPTVVYTPAIESKTIPDIEDGVWYLHVQFKNDHGWGAINHYLFKVDGTKPESFVIKPLSTSDDTDPTPQFSFNATDSGSGIDHYTVQIDLKDPITWRDDGTSVFTAPTLSPGPHTIIAKAFDEANNFTSTSIDFSVAGITAPKITSYPEKISDSSPLVVKGVSSPNAMVKAVLAKSDDDPFTQTVTSDNQGNWAVVFDSELPSGAYKLTAVAMDKRGAQSEPSPEKVVLVRTSWLISLGYSVMSALAITVPIAALAFAIVFIFMFGFHKIRIMKKKLRKELHDVERMVDKAFALLKEDVEDSIH